LVRTRAWLQHQFVPLALPSLLRTLRYTIAGWTPATAPALLLQNATLRSGRSRATLTCHWAAPPFSCQHARRRSFRHPSLNIVLPSSHNALPHHCLSCAFPRLCGWLTLFARQRAGQRTGLRAAAPACAGVAALFWCLRTSARATLSMRVCGACAANAACNDKPLLPLRAAPFPCGRFGSLGFGSTTICTRCSAGDDVWWHLPRRTSGPLGRDGGFALPAADAWTAGGAVYGAARWVLVDLASTRGGMRRGMLRRGAALPLCTWPATAATDISAFTTTGFRDNADYGARAALLLSLFDPIGM